MFTINLNDVNYYIILYNYYIIIRHFSSPAYKDVI